MKGGRLLWGKGVDAPGLRLSCASAEGWRKEAAGRWDPQITNIKDERTSEVTCYQFSSVQFSHSVFPSVFPSIRVFSNESVLCIRWPKYWRFSFSISPSNKYSGLISLRIDWFDLLAVQRTLKSFLQYHMLSGPEKNKKSRNQSFLMIIRKCITVEVMFKESRPSHFTVDVTAWPT